MSLLDFLRPQQAQVPGAMSQPSGLSQMLQPEVMAAMAGQLLGNQGNAANFGNAFSAAAPVMAQQKELQAQTRAKNQTVELLKREAPDIAAAVESGALTAGDGYKVYFERRKAQGPEGYKVVGDQIFNTADQSWIKPPSSSGGEFRFSGNAVEAQALNGLIESRQLTPEQAQQLAAGKTITNPADGSMVFMTPQGVFGQSPGGQPQPLAGQPQGTAGQPGAAQLGPGLIPLTPGKPGKLQTEAERRNQSLYHVVEPQLKIAIDNFDSLSQLGNQAVELGGELPGIGGAIKAVGNYATTPQYQQARNAMKTIVASYLYSVSGATANPGEVENQVDVLMPRPGEDSASVADKKQRLKDMVEAVRLAGGNSAPAQGGTSMKTKYGLP